MPTSERGPIISKEYMKVLKGTLLAIGAGLSIQGCSRVGGGIEAPLPTSPSIETKQPIQSKTDVGGFVPKITVIEEPLGDPIITIGGSVAAEQPVSASSSEKVPITIILDGPTPSEQQPEQVKQDVIASLDTPQAGPVQEATVSTDVQTPEQPSQDFSSLDQERLKDIANKIEHGTADDEIVERGRTIQIYSTKLKNGMSFVLVKENVDKHWDGKQSSVVFYDKRYQYVAYNTVKFGMRYLDDGTQELRFGKGKSSATVRNAYVTPDPSGVSVLLSSREVTDSVDFLTRAQSISIYQQREDTDPITNQKTVNIGGYVEKPTEFMKEWEWLLDQASGKHIYSLDLQSDGTFKEGSKSSVEINPTKNLE